MSGYYVRFSIYNVLFLFFFAESLHLSDLFSNFAKLIAFNET